MESKGFHRKLTAILSADVAGYSRLMQDDEGKTVVTLESYKQGFFDLIKDRSILEKNIEALRKAGLPDKSPSAQP
jgi:hypothetical protein